MDQASAAHVVQLQEVEGEAGECEGRRSGHAQLSRTF